MLILLSNAPGRLLPTIRSRCQRLLLRPLPGESSMPNWRGNCPNWATRNARRVARLTGGSLGVALQLASGEGLALARDADRLIDAASHPDIVALMGLADRIARMKDGLETLGEFLALTLSDRIRERARSGGGDLKPWVDVWEELRGSLRARERIASGAAADDPVGRPRAVADGAARDPLTTISCPCLSTAIAISIFPNSRPSWTRWWRARKPPASSICVTIGTTLGSYPGVRGRRANDFRMSIAPSACIRMRRKRSR